MGELAAVTVRISVEDDEILTGFANAMGQSKASIVRYQIHQICDFIRLTAGDMKEDPKGWQTRAVNRGLLSMSSALDELEGIQVQQQLLKIPDALDQKKGAKKQ